MTETTEASEMQRQNGQLSFDIDLEEGGAIHPEIPVEVRKSNLALVARVLSSRSVDIAPDTYYVTAMLPSGEELFDRVVVAPGEEATVRLAPEPEDVSAESEDAPFIYDWRGVAKGAGPLRGVTALEGLGPASPDVKLRAFQGNILRGEFESENDFISSVEQEEGRTRITTSGDDPAFVQVLRADMPVWNVAVPTCFANQCDVILATSPDGIIDVDVQLGNEEADLLLRYFRRGFLKEASTMTEAMQAEELLYKKMADPVSAAVGAYALLRFGEIDRLHDWTENLKNWFEWLPDGLIVRAEHLARIGEHDQALSLFLELPERGLPLFSTGLTYTLNRLRLYLSMGEDQFEASPRERALVLYKQLKQYREHANLDKPMLVFTGLDPTRPGDGVLSAEEFSNADGEEIGSN